jgi:hypothetical protein
LLALDRHLVAAGGEREERVHRNKGVPADFFAADDAFEQRGVAAVIQQVERTHGREGIAEEAAINGDELMTRGEFLSVSQDG